ncbi:MAG: DivIVA domain-containing protein [Gordonia sp. (in: high G+C Gram-positive bacteria)]|uniref:DivIVA-like cell division protein Wag31 n=1 Tax=Gordonia sp. (in: high G+C Gram-positive bacteria) TaxID=84139 RepID=UPI0039E5D37E
MRLTPADVHNVAFSKPPIGKRGYNEDEVDQFLDFVEAELARLLDENADLRQRCNELEGELAEARSGGGSDRTQAFVQQPAAPEAPTMAAPIAPVPAPAPVAPAAGDVDEDAGIRAARILGLAQDTADRVTASARSEAESLLTDARQRSDAMIAEAQAQADATVNDANQRSEALLADAQTRAEVQVRQAQERADFLQRDAEQKHSEIMATVNQQRAVLDGRIEQLKNFEREYRTRLKAYLESQLDELQQRGSAAPVDAGQAYAPEAGYPQG